MRYLQSSHKELPVGEVKLSNEDMKRMLGQSEDAIISRTVLMGAIAIRQALQHAGISDKEQRARGIGRRIVLINGTTVGGMDITERYVKASPPSSLLKERGDNKPFTLREGWEKAFEKHDCGSTTREMADLAGLEDAEVCTVSTACSSAVNAIILGSEMLKAGEADIVIAGGTEALSRFHLNGFNSLMILSGEQCRPFDKMRAGLNLGEGAAFVVLQTPSNSPSKGRTSEKESLPIEGEVWRGSVFIRGYANRCDAFHQTASSEDGEGAFLAMSDALQMAGLKPQDIQYINAHGTGTPNNDTSESAAIRRVFGENIPPVSSTKGFTGHTTSASGAIETVICILALLNDFIPANLGWKEQDEECITPFGSEESRMRNEEFASALNTSKAGVHGQGNTTAAANSSSFSDSLEPRRAFDARSTLHSSLKNVLCNSFGFGGNDSAIVISKEPAPLQPPPEEGGFKIIGEASISTPDKGELEGIREFLSPGEARRMGKLMKAATITSIRALRQAGIESPDAIITATAYGMLETSEKFLVDMHENGEETLSPTLFMQSTHNTLSSAIAIRTKCHGYNMTYTQGADSLEWALRDARRLIESGKAKTVLVGCHDESTPTFQECFRRMGKPVPPLLTSRSIVLAAAND